MFGNVVKDITYRSSSNFTMWGYFAFFGFSATVPDVYFKALLPVESAFVS